MSTSANCRLCGSTYTVRGITRHLQACIPKHTDRLETESGQERPGVHVTVRAGGMCSGDYRLDLMVDSQASLSTLDRVLRNVWMECCGHMSSFWRDRPWGHELSDQQTFGRVSSYDDIVYGYDFGTTSIAEVQMKDTYALAAPAAAVQCIARNEPPEITCQACGEHAATQLCPYCVYQQAAAVFCESCAADHEQGGCPQGVGEGMMMPILNSPRSGLCGYTGPSVEPNRLSSPATA